MVVVLTATLPQDGVFFAGEKFSCTLTFTNVIQPAPSQETAHSGPAANGGVGPDRRPKPSRPMSMPAGMTLGVPPSGPGGARSLGRQPVVGRDQLPHQPPGQLPPASTSTDPSSGPADHPRNPSAASSIQGGEAALQSFSNSPMLGNRAEGPAGVNGEHNSRPFQRHIRSISESIPLAPSSAGDPTKRVPRTDGISDSGAGSGSGSGGPKSEGLARTLSRTLSISTLRSIAGSLFGPTVSADSQNPSQQQQRQQQQRQQQQQQPRNSNAYDTRPFDQLTLDQQQQRREQLSSIQSESILGSQSGLAGSSVMRGPSADDIFGSGDLPTSPGMRRTVSDLASPSFIEMLSPQTDMPTPLLRDLANDRNRLDTTGPADDTKDGDSLVNSTVGRNSESFSDDNQQPVQPESHEDERGQANEEGGKIFLQSSSASAADHRPSSKRRSVLPTDAGAVMIDGRDDAGDDTLGEPSPRPSTMGSSVTLSSSAAGRVSPALSEASPTSRQGGLASSSSSSLLPQPLRINGKTAAEGAREEIAWAFAQMTGQFTVDPSFIKAGAFEPLRQKIMYRTAGSSSGLGAGAGSGSSSAVGGGGGSLGMGATMTLNAGAPAAVPRNEIPPLPLYSTPPSILFCDESLGPGESKSFKYEILLPAVLPPSHRGKIARFFYKLIVGIQRNGRIRQSQIISIPFRLFNRTNANGTRPVYEVMNPVIVNKDDATVAAVPPPGMGIAVPVSPGGAMAQRAQLLGQASSLDFDEYTTTMNNIMNFCQSSKKVSYEICKNNEHVAQLTLPRVSHRLGESIQVILNFTNGSIPCFQVSAYLESVEQVDSPFSVKAKQQTSSYTRRCHTELHRNTLNARRLVLSVAIPSTATADFQSTAVSVQWSLRIEFVTGKSGQLLTGQHSTGDGFQHQQGLQRMESEPFDCTIPLKVFGGMRALKRTSKRLMFNIASMGIPHSQKVWELAKHVAKDGPLADPRRMGSLPHSIQRDKRVLPTLMHGKRITFGDQVSEKGGNRSRRVWMPNVVYRPLYSRALDMSVWTRLTTTALREIDAAGGIDEYMISVPHELITCDIARMYQRRITDLYKASATSSGTSRLTAEREEMFELLGNTYGPEYAKLLRRATASLDEKVAKKFAENVQDNLA
ncbi:Rgp1-domain-containing protein [Entophlyctis helioformis]|nr:Rgp1-domain-containing protein [Entophlyctis helioformis]